MNGDARDRLALAPPATVQAGVSALAALQAEQRQLARRCGALALAAVLLFLFVCASAQGLRTELDWQRTPLSFYLVGDFGLVVKAAYLALAIGLVMLGLGARLAFGPRSRLAPWLFLLAGTALLLTALFDTDIAGTRSVTGRVHGLAAQASFLCVTLAMLAQSWTLRVVPGWQRRFAPALTLALLATAALWLHAFWREPPRGLMQKGVIVLILAWLGLFAYWLRSPTSARGGDDPAAERGAGLDPPL